MGSPQPGWKKILIISFDLLGREQQGLPDGQKNRFRQQGMGGRPFDFLIVDESQFVKEGKSNRTQAVLEVARKAKHALLLSGTPSLNRPPELFTQLCCLLPETQFRVCFDEFAERYSKKKVKKINGGKHEVVSYEGALRGDELNMLLKTTCMSYCGTSGWPF